MGLHQLKACNCYSRKKFCRKRLWLREKYIKPPSSIQILTILGDMAKEEPVPEAGFLFITPALESERPRPRTETGANAYSGS